LIEAFNLERLGFLCRRGIAVAIAVMAAPLVSATRRIPSGPNASGPMDLNSGLPSFMPSVQLAAWIEVAAIPSAHQEKQRSASRFHGGVPFI
jgi:hypothetical protein